MMRFYKNLIIFGVLLFFLISCYQETVSTLPYPINIADNTVTYPEPYPLITPDLSVSDKTSFILNKPLIEGSTEIRGTGLPGIAITINDVTFMGEILGQTTIKSDGTFVVTVPPLEKGHRIGLSLGNLEGTKWKPEDFQNPGYNGDEAMLVPMVGFFFDTAMVQPKP